MDEQGRKDQYQVIFSGSAEEGARRAQVMRNVQRLLKVDDRMIARLFDGTRDRIVFRTADRALAELLAARLREAGAIARIADSGDKNTPDWRTWSLEKKQNTDFKVFHCPSCNYSTRLPPGTAVPEVCPECRVVVAKFEANMEKKRQAENIRRRLLEQKKAEEEREARLAKAAEMAALRKKIEREVRRELGLRYRTRLRISAGLSVALALALGVALTLLLGSQRPSSDDAASTVFFDLPPATITGNKTIYMANQTLDKLAGAAAYSTAAQETYFVFTGAYPSDPVHSAELDLLAYDLPECGLTAAMLNPLSPVGAGGEGDLIANGMAGQAGQSKAPGTATREQQMAQYLGEWDAQDSAATLQALRLSQLIKGQQLDGGQADAVRGTLNDHQGAQRTALLLSVTEDASRAACPLAAMSDYHCLGMPGYLRTSCVFAPNQ